MKRGCTCLCN